MGTCVFGFEPIINVEKRILHFTLVLRMFQREGDINFLAVPFRCLGIISDEGGPAQAKGVMKKSQISTIGCFGFPIFTFQFKAASLERIYRNVIILSD